jgi:deazaflavin-dependent oxidoreductase (nitroreductase family)
MPPITDGLNAKIIEEFRANGGKVSAGAQGGPFEGTQMILLHHRGARTGIQRVNPLVYLKVGDSYAVFASKAGAPTHPAWYHNVLASPNTQIEVGTETFDVTAREMEGRERQQVWEHQKRLLPVFAEYEEKTKGIRQIPIILLERPP